MNLWQFFVKWCYLIPSATKSHGLRQLSSSVLSWSHLETSSSISDSTSCWEFSKLRLVKDASPLQYLCLRFFVNLLLRSSSFLNGLEAFAGFLFFNKLKFLWVFDENNFSIYNICQHYLYKFTSPKKQLITSDGSDLSSFSFCDFWIHHMFHIFCYWQIH